jgi:hypothetical protein
MGHIPAICFNFDCCYLYVFIVVTKRDIYAWNLLLRRAPNKLDRFRSIRNACPTFLLIWQIGNSDINAHFLAFFAKWATVTIEQWAFIKDCLFTSSWFRQFWHTTNNTLTKLELGIKISFLRSRNSLFTMQTGKSQPLHVQQQYRKREREIKSPWNLGSLKHYLNTYFLKC